MLANSDTAIHVVFFFCYHYLLIVKPKILFSLARQKISVNTATVSVPCSLSFGYMYVYKCSKNKTSYVSCFSLQNKYNPQDAVDSFFLSVRVVEKAPVSATTKENNK